MWLTPFSEWETRPSPFHLADGITVAVPTMIATPSARTAETEDARILELPYCREEAVFFVVLPRARDGLNAVESELSDVVLHLDPRATKLASLHFRRRGHAGVRIGRIPDRRVQFSA